LVISFGVQSIGYFKFSLKESMSKIRNEDDCFVGSETWKAILEPELCKDSAAVECLARLLFIIKKEMNSGADGIVRASKILSNGIEFMYLYTNAHKAAVKLFVISLEGQLKPQDEPLNLISGAIERGNNQVKHARKTKR
jgi:hypothetical protein